MNLDSQTVIKYRIVMNPILGENCVTFGIYFSDPTRLPETGLFFQTRFLQPGVLHFQTTA